MNLKDGKGGIKEDLEEERNYKLIIIIKTKKKHPLE